MAPNRNSSCRYLPVCQLILISLCTSHWRCRDVILFSCRFSRLNRRKQGLTFPLLTYGSWNSDVEGLTLQSLLVNTLITTRIGLFKNIYFGFFVIEIAMIIPDIWRYFTSCFKAFDGGCNPIRFLHILRRWCSTCLVFCCYVDIFRCLGAFVAVEWSISVIAD